MRRPVRCRSRPSATLCPLADHVCHGRHAGSLGAELPQQENERGAAQHVSGLAGSCKERGHWEGCECP